MEPRHGSDQKGARQESELGVEEAGWYNEIALFDLRIGNRNAIHLMDSLHSRKLWTLSLQWMQLGCNYAMCGHKATECVHGMVCRR